MAPSQLISGIDARTTAAAKILGYPRLLIANHSSSSAIGSRVSTVLCGPSPYFAITCTRHGNCTIPRSVSMAGNSAYEGETKVYAIAVRNAHRRLPVKCSASRKSVTGPRQVAIDTMMRYTVSGDAHGSSRIHIPAKYGRPGTYMNCVGSPQYG